MASRQHELITLSEPQRWRAALEEVTHGHAHSWGFCRAVQMTSGRPTFLYRYAHEDVRVVCAISERSFAGHVDVVTPYGFGGFARNGHWVDFPDAWADFARSRDWVCGYVALNPLLTDADGFPDDEVHVHTNVYGLDIRGTEQEILLRMAGNRRRQLRDWAQLRERLVTDRSELEEFLVASHEQFFARRGAGLATEFSQDTMRAIAQLDDVMLVGAGEGRRVDAVALFGRGTCSADYLFNISAPGGERFSAQLVWAGVEWARTLGLEHVHLGGGINPGDGLARFKRWFGAVELPQRSLRQIYRPDVYDRLVREASPDTRSDGYFPAYRSTSSS